MVSPRIHSPPFLHYLHLSHNPLHLPLTRYLQNSRRNLFKMASGGLQDAAFLRNFHQYFENLPQGDKARIARLMSLHKTIGYKNYSPSRNIYCNNLGFSRLIPGTNQPVFNQTPKFYNQIQMLAPMADCVCGPKNTGPASISHMCCGSRRQYFSIYPYSALDTGVPKYTK
jgi:hypothetical protein